MKELKITLIVILSVIILGLMALLFYGISQDDFWENIPTKTATVLAKEHRVDITDINAIEIDYNKTGSDIRVYQSDSEDLIIKEFKQKKYKESELASISTNQSGTLNIKGKRTMRNFVVFGWEQEYTEIYLPKNYDKAFMIKTASGDIELLEEWTFSNVEIASSSGEIEIGNIMANTTELSSASGDITVMNLNGKFDIHTASGEIEISDGAAFGKASTSSGDIEIDLTKVNGDIEMNTASGENTLTIPHSTAFVFKASTSSGEITTFFDSELAFDNDQKNATGSIGGKTKSAITIESSSGDIEVLKK